MHFYNDEPLSIIYLIVKWHWLPLFFVIIASATEYIHVLFVCPITFVTYVFSIASYFSLLYFFRTKNELHINKAMSKRLSFDLKCFFCSVNLSYSWSGKVKWQCTPFANKMLSWIVIKISPKRREWLII